MKIAAVTRIAATLSLVGLFVSDYMFAVWVKEVPRETYLFLIAVALGVDVEFLRNVLIQSLSRSLGAIKSEDKEE